MRNLSLVNDSQPAPFWHTQLIYNKITVKRKERKGKERKGKD